MLLTERPVKNSPSKEHVIDHSSLSERLEWLDNITKLPSPGTGWSQVPGHSPICLCLSQAMEQK